MVDLQYISLEQWTDQDVIMSTSCSVKCGVQNVYESTFSHLGSWSLHYIVKLHKAFSSKGKIQVDPRDSYFAAKKCYAIILNGTLKLGKQISGNIVCVVENLHSQRELRSKWYSWHMNKSLHDNIQNMIALTWLIILPIIKPYVIVIVLD